MVEMVIVVVIIGILTIMAFPRVDIFHVLKFQAAGKKVLSDIRYAQSVAVLNHAYTGIQFWPGSNLYYANFCDAGCIPFSAANWPPLKDPLSGNNLNLGVNYVTDSQYRGIVIASSNFGSTIMLVFNPDGAPIDANSNSALSANGTIVLKYSGETINVNVAAKSGKVYVSKSF
jgi:Tfp pilus assembly protein FimT